MKIPIFYRVKINPKSFRILNMPIFFHKYQKNKQQELFLKEIEDKICPSIWSVN